MLVNVDPLNPNNSPSPEHLRRIGFGGVRLVSRDNQVVRDYADSCQAWDMFVLAVVTEQSGGYLLPDADWYQIGNEPDVAGTKDSMDPQAYKRYWNLYRDTYPHLTMIAAGLGSGQTSYWALVGELKGCNGFAVHPYAKRVQTARNLLRAYKAMTPNLSLIVTEWWRPPQEVPEFAQMLSQEAAMHGWFSWGYNEFAINSWQLRGLRAVGAL